MYTNTNTYIHNITITMFLAPLTLGAVNVHEIHHACGLAARLDPIKNNQSASMLQNHSVAARTPHKCWLLGRPLTPLPQRRVRTAPADAAPPALPQHSRCIPENIQYKTGEPGPPRPAPEAGRRPRGARPRGADGTVSERGVQTLATQLPPGQARVHSYPGTIRDTRVRLKAQQSS